MWYVGFLEASIYLGYAYIRKKDCSTVSMDKMCIVPCMISVHVKLIKTNIPKSEFRINGPPLLIYILVSVCYA